MHKSAVPTYRARYYTMMEAIKEHLIPLGFQISTGKSYDTQSHSAANGVVNGHANGITNGHADKRVQVAGGYFTYLTTPADLPISVAELAALGLQKYNLKFAFGGMMTVEGDESMH